MVEWLPSGVYSPKQLSQGSHFHEQAAIPAGGDGVGGGDELGGEGSGGGDGEGGNGGAAGKQRKSQWLNGPLSNYDILAGKRTRKSSDLKVLALLLVFIAYVKSM